MSVLSSKRRIPYIDGLRGYLIYSMTVSHVGTIVGISIFSFLSHKIFTVFFTGEGFMFISGLMIGYIFTGVVYEKGLIVSLKGSFKRSFRIFRYYILVYLLCSLPLLFMAVNENEYLFSFFKNIDPLSLRSFILFLMSVYRPMMFDILFLYVVMIFVSPFVIYFYKKGYVYWVIGASFFFWSLVQYELSEKLVYKAAEIFQFNELNILGSFDIFAWQFPFVIGLLIGVKYALQNDFFVELFKRYGLVFFKFSFPVLIVFFIYRFAIDVNLIAYGYHVFTDYLSLSFFTLLNFSVFSLVLVALLVRGSDGFPKFFGFLEKTLVKLLRSEILTVLGKHSLQTFSASVVFTYWIAAIYPYVPWKNSWVNSLFVIAIMLLLFAVGKLQVYRVRKLRR